MDNRYKEALIRQIDAGINQPPKQSEGDKEAGRVQAQMETFQRLTSQMPGGSGSEGAKALRTAIQIGGGNPIVAEAALLALTGEGYDLNENGKIDKGERITTPRGNQLSQGYLADLLQQYYRAGLVPPAAAGPAGGSSSLHA